jgi:UDP-N-acetylglucosamine acyltransferase
VTYAAPVIHPSAIVASSAELGSGVEIGPYSIIGPQVCVGENTWVGPHVVIDGRTTLGRDNRVFQFASVGAIPQDKKYRGEDSTLIIGNGNSIREFATLNPGTSGGGMVTRVGDNNLFMVYSHVAHDCIIGNHVILANGATLAGHVTLEDYVNVGGLVGIHQFSRIGESALLAAGSMVSLDVPPYCVAVGDRAHLAGLNLIGLKRRGFGNEQLVILKRVYRMIFNEGGPLKEALARVNHKYPNTTEIAHFVDFISNSHRGVCRPRRNVASDGEGELR